VGGRNGDSGRSFLPRVFQLCSLSCASGRVLTGGLIRYWDEVFAIVAMSIRVAGCSCRKGATMKAFTSKIRSSPDASRKERSDARLPNAV
jgi:hypothetical protein